ncbi:hypothetical protein GCM10007907_17710 [Chitinimonas prasina]|uniref:Uncharacterized protein n=1 Tax=Chitinimonas prasina TaxID=1434937 RepID=A0ABQ5YDD7_9NEIS|nr:hypothetical protein GCM10007907_17710 [Chitinimonas prasina]
MVGGGAASSAGQPATGTSLVTTTPETSLVAVNGNGMLKTSTGAGQGGSAAAGDVLLLGLGPIDPSRVVVPNNTQLLNQSGGVGGVSFPHTEAWAHYIHC